jgi:hypothetical protein
MPRLSVNELRVLFNEVIALAEKVEELDTLAGEAVGDTKSAYAVVHKDYLWKIQRKIGQLWYYVCGSDVMNPFEDAKSDAE